MLRRRFYLRLCLCFIILLVICIPTLAVVCNYMFSSAIDEEMYKANVEALNSIVHNTDTTLEGIDRMALQIAEDPNTLYFTTTKLSDDYIRLMRFLQTLNGLKASNPLLDSIYVYYRDENDIITSPEWKKSINTFYDKEWISSLDFSMQSQWMLGRSFDKPVGTGTKKEEKKVISYVRYLPIQSVYKNGAVVINIDYEKFCSLYKQGQKVNGRVMVLNSEGALIVSTLDDEGLAHAIMESADKLKWPTGYDKLNIKGRKYLVSYSTGKNMWKYMCITPVSSLVTVGNMLRNMIVLCTIAILLLGLQLSFAFSKKLYTPVDDLVSMFTEDKEGRDEYSYRALTSIDKSYDEFNVIRDLVTRIVNTNKKLEYQTRQTIPYAIERILLGLFHGNISLDELGKCGFELKLDSYNRFVVTTVDLDDYQGLIQSHSDDYIHKLHDFIVGVFENRTLEECDCYIKVVATSAYQWTCLFAAANSSSKDEEILDQIYKICEDAKALINQAFRLSITIGLSTVGHHAAEIHDLYSQAGSAVQYRILQGRNSIRYFGYTPFENKPLYSYPQKQEDLIISALKALDEEKAYQGVKGFVEYIRACKGMDDRQVYYIFAQLLGSVVKVVYELGGSITEVWEGENIYQYLSACRFLNEIEYTLKFIINKCFNYLRAKQENKYCNIVDAAIKYMENHYSDNQISVDTIAEKVYLSSCYLEKLFKDVKGKTVMEYLLAIRMEKAKELLKETNLKVESIAGKVGYNTSRGFIRAFKKYEGQTPGQYRERLLELGKNGVIV